MSGAIPRHQRALKSLGLTRIDKSVVLPDNPSTQGIVAQLRHLIEVNPVRDVQEASDAVPRREKPKSLPEDGQRGSNGVKEEHA